MDVLMMLKTVMNEKGINESKLAKLSGIPQSTINSIFRNNRNLTFYTLEKLCNGLDVSLSDFFNEGEKIDKITNYDSYDDLKDIIESYSKLTPRQRKATKEMLVTFTTKE